MYFHKSTGIFRGTLQLRQVMIPHACLKNTSCWLGRTPPWQLNYGKAISCPKGTRDKIIIYQTLIKGFHPDLEYPQRTILPFFDILTIAQHRALREDIGGERGSPYLIAWLVRKPVVASKAALNLGASYKLTEVRILNKKWPRSPWGASFRSNNARDKTCLENWTILRTIRGVEDFY